ncbi:hypothetical protein [Streptomyces sp. NPDC001205]
MKRRIGSPQVPPGAQYAFFQLMQRHVLKQGDKSLASLSKESGWSRQTWHKALRGPELPNRDLVKALVEHLFPELEGVDRQRRMVTEALDAWTAAVDERTFGPLEAQAKSSSAPRGANPLRTGEGLGGPGQLPERPGNSPQSVMAPFQWNAAKRRENLPEEARFFRLFSDYYVKAGSPPVRWVAARMPEDLPVTRSTLSDWLTGRSLPTYGKRLEKVMEIMCQSPRVIDRELASNVAARAEIQLALSDAWRARPL